ncbi:MAG TPA: 1-(5-phosphoribosyl)-5-[(5-phosphoribosylamino)methylideneamino] imidazole-4-carboxamide isomerase [Chloroflexia bacterium]|nr:1-(5-phosphoribosyl)-5-[(5-phosphoribosylamino)methylideneamino] imidazole-4-carboxamide isomerase [Chloroflexia bacterium]
MEILPAIDIIAGRVVRLRQGDYEQVTTFAESVLDAGRRWQAEGATWLHVVDLDGARAGQPANTDLILRLRAALTLRIEVGGGLRTPADTDRLLDAGIDRVVLGTAALENPTLLDHVLARGPETLAVALDARDGIVATGGWLASSGQRAESVAAALAARGVRVFSHTDIARDGGLGGPNTAALAGVQAAVHAASSSPARVIASGGVCSVEDVRALRRMGLHGAIIGRALYTGALRLPEALAAATGKEDQHD